jgi:hypothetical protein
MSWEGKGKRNHHQCIGTIILFLLKNITKMLRVVEDTCNPSTQKPEAGGFWVWDQLKLQSENLSQKPKSPSMSFSLSSSQFFKPLIMTIWVSLSTIILFFFFRHLLGSFCPYFWQWRIRRNKKNKVLNTVSQWLLHDKYWESFERVREVVLCSLNLLLFMRKYLILHIDAGYVNIKVW